MPLKASRNVISSPGLGAGRLPCASPAGLSVAPFGRAPAPVSPSQAPASVRVPPTAATSGPSSCGSSRSVALQQSLASRLRANLVVNGSPEYVLTLKHWAMEWGPRIFAVRASARHTSGKGFTGWPTASATDAKGVSGPGRDANKRKKGCNPADRLPNAAALAGWATPTRGDAHKVKPFHDAPQPALAYQCHLAGWVSPGASDGNGGKGVRKGVSPTGKMPDGSKAHMDLSAFTKYQLAGWASPTAHEKRRSLEFQQGRELNALEALASGTPTISSTAATTRYGVLNPAFSAWLMGLPSVWLMAAPVRTSRVATSSEASATPSSRKLQPCS
jgi:hypothetical protein